MNWQAPTLHLRIRRMGLGVFLMVALTACESNGTAETPDTTRADTIAARSGGQPDSVPPALAPSAVPPGSASSTRDKLYPIDDADQDPSFFAFRMHLAQAVAARDHGFLLEQLSEGIRLSFGDDAGKADFMRMWNPTSRESEVWEILGRVLAGGGILHRESPETGAAMFQAPYYYAAFPGERYDAFLHGVIVGDGVVARSRPDSASPAVDTLSFDIVRVPDFAPVDGSWIRVHLGEDGGGFVPARFVASPVGYRAIFNKTDGRWLMTALVAGD